MGPLAKFTEQSPEKAYVGGSIPSLATTLNGVVIDSFKILISLSVLSNGVDPTRTPSRKETWHKYER